MSNASFASAPHLFSFTPDDFARTEKYPFGNLVLPSCKILFLPTFLQCLQLREQNVGGLSLFVYSGSWTDEGTYKNSKPIISLDRTHVR